MFLSSCKTSPTLSLLSELDNLYFPSGLDVFFSLHTQWERGRASVWAYRLPGDRCVCVWGTDGEGLKCGVSRWEKPRKEESDGILLAPG